ncbi:MAG: dihydroorotate dehydrogenase electron transfer subunit, partial [Candidatus Woesearchaeota archaeon]|nr:dihydroorotate dehydrogenase electron transfer subunit [Candidatus Woesearchaeota archaeon]
QAICSSPEIATTYLKAVQEVTKKPIIVKLSPNIENIKPVAKALIDAGVDGITAVNTVGPEENKEPISGEVVLSHKTGGISGNEITEIGLDKVRQIKEVCSEYDRTIPIIGMGGISCYDDVKAYEEAGADIIGIGTALTGLDTEQTKKFFSNIENPEKETYQIDNNLMQFSELTINKVDRLAEDLIIQHFDQSIECKPGQFYFLWIPGYMEKPLAPAITHPATFAVRVIGPFTTKLSEMNPGEKIMIRGPYGNGFTIMDKKMLHYNLIGGGTGIAPLIYLAEELAKKGISKEHIHVFLGGRSANQIYFSEKFNRIADVHVSTDDGSLGYKGFVTDMLEQYLKKHLDRRAYNYICGPEIMMKKAFDIAKEYPHEEIEASIERYMKCGVGICGICSMDGMRTCVDGTVFNKEFLEKSKCFGVCHRKKTGEIEKY